MPPPPAEGGPPPAIPAGEVASDPAHAGDASRDERRPRSAIAFAVGLALLAAAAAVVATNHAALTQAWASFSAAPPWLIGAALALPLANWLLVSLSIRVLIGHYGRVGTAEMAALAGAAWLLNYLPLRPGLVGRLAYHKAVNRIAVRDSALVTLAGIGCTAVAVALLLGIVVVLHGRAGPAGWTVALGAPAAVLGAASLGARALRWPWRLATMLTVRYLDVLAWTARYAVVFALVGSPIDLPAAAAIAAVSQAAFLVPLVGNGLGLREWAVGLTAAALPAELIGAGAAGATPVALAADLANRAAEVAMAVPVGLLSWAWLSPRLRRARARG